METISAEEFKKRYGNKGLESFKQPEPKKGIGTTIANAFKGGIEQVKSGFQQTTKQGGSIKSAPLDLIEGVGKIGSGIVNAAFSPLAPVIEPTVGKAINYAGDKISNIPAVQKFANSKAGEITSRVTEDIANYNNIAGAVAGGMETPKVGGAIADTAGNVANKAGQAVGEVTGKIVYN